MELPEQGYGPEPSDGPFYEDIDTEEPMDGHSEENMQESHDDSIEENPEESSDGNIETGTEDTVEGDEDSDAPDISDTLEDTENTGGENIEEGTGDAGANEEEDTPEDAPEITDTDISGNSIISVSGNALIFPEDFDLSQLNGNADTSSGTEIVEAIKAQTEFMFVTSAVIVFLLGTIVGVTLIHGIRLRRV